MFRLTGGHLGKHIEKKKKTHGSQRHDVYGHASFGSAAPACCTNLHTGADLHRRFLVQCDQTKGGEMAGLHCTNNGESCVKRALEDFPKPSGKSLL